MAYEYKEEIENHIICAPVHVDDELFDELEEVYAKAKLWDSIYGMTTDKAILSKIFDDEMYKLLHQTDKSEATIILEIIQLFLDRLERD